MSSSAQVRIEVKPTRVSLLAFLRWGSMARAFTYFLIFILGVLLALVLGFRAQIGLFLAECCGAGAYANEALQAPAVLPIESPRELMLPQRDGEVQNPAFQRYLSAETRKLSLINALKDGSPEALQNLRMEYLSVLPEYQSQLLPDLKKQVLESLLARFSEADWSSWTAGSYAPSGKPTLARAFIDDLTTVNPDLGKFAETAAQLFYGLRSSLLAGKSYQLADDMYYVLQHAEQLLPKRRPLAVPARFFLDASVINDPSFLDVLERLRRDFTLLYAGRFPNELEAQLMLFGELHQGYVDENTALALHTLLYHLIFNGRPLLRDKAAKAIIQMPVFLTVAERDEKVRRTLAEFFLICAVDALEEGAHDKAQGMLALSRQTQPGMEAQNVLGQFLEDSGSRKAETLRAKKKGDDSGKEKIADLFRDKSSSSPKGSSSLERILIFVVLAGVVAFVGLRLFLAFLAHRNQLISAPEHPLSRTNTSPGISVTQPSELRFGEEPELKVANR